MTYVEATSIPSSFIPSSFKCSNYLEVFSRAPFLRYFGNTLFVSLSYNNMATVIILLLAAFAVTSLQFKGKKYRHDDFSFSINGSLRINHLYKLPNNRSIRVIKHLCSVNHSVLNKYLLYLLLERILKGIPSTFYKAAKIDGAVI